MNKIKLKEKFNKVAECDELKGASWSITLKDKNYKIIFGHNSDKFLIPASTIKVLTTATALLVLGPSYQFENNLYFTGKIENGVLKGNLFVKGFGDPTFCSRDFEETKPHNVFKKIIDILKENSISEIQGTLIVDNSFIDNKFLYLDWSLEDFPYYYGAIPNAINFLDNYFLVKQSGSKLITETIEAVDADLLLRECNTIEDMDIDELKILGCPYCEKKTFYLNPKLQTQRYRDYKISLAKPHLAFADSLRRFLEAQDINIRNEYIGYRNLDKTLLGAILSPPLLQILQNVNFKSNNLFAESLYQLLLKNFIQKGETLNSYWLKMIGNNKFVINDGSGLSRVNFITTDFISELLMFMYLKKDDFGNFFDTLPQLSKEGTVKDFCKDIEAKNIVRFKTGGMSGVRGFAGIIEGSEALSFSIIFNNYQCTTTEINILAENIFKEFALS